MRSGFIRASRPIMYFVLNSTEVSRLSLFSLFHLEGIKLRVRWHDDVRYNPPTPTPFDRRRNRRHSLCHKTEGSAPFLKEGAVKLSMSRLPFGAIGTPVFDVPSADLKLTGPTVD